MRGPGCGLIEESTVGVGLAALIFPTNQSQGPLPGTGVTDGTRQLTSSGLAPVLTGLALLTATRQRPPRRRSHID